MSPTGLAPPPDETDAPDSAAGESGVVARPVIPGHTRRTVPQRFLGGPLWISFAAHLFAFVALLLYVQLGPEAGSIWSTTESPEVQMVELVTPAEIVLDEVVPPAESAADAGPVEPVAEVPVSPSPAADAGGEPAPAPPPVITAEGGETEVAQPEEAAGGSVAERLRPGFSDPRLYADPEAVRMTRPGPSDMDRYRDHLQARIDAMNDSIYGRRGPNTDWTVRDGSGNRWGVSEDGVHLGPVTIPRALVPVPAASGTNQDLEAERERQRQRDEIQRQEADRERREALQESRERAAERRRESGGSDR